MPDSKLSPAITGMYSRDLKQGSYHYVRTGFWTAGQNSYVEAPSQDEDSFSVLFNILPVTRGPLETRWGYGAFGTAQTAAVRRWFPYYNDTTGTRAFMGIVPAATPYLFSVTESGAAYGSNINIPSGSQSAAKLMYGTVSRNYLYLLDGQAADQIKWSGAASGGTSKWGIDAPPTAVDVGAPTTGGVSLNSGRNYFVVWGNNTTGHHSDLSPVSASTGPLTNQQVPLSNIPQPSDTQVNQIVLLATADAGDQTTLYKLGSVSVGTTSFTDNIPEESLLLLPVWQDTDGAGVQHGVADNAPPPTTNGIVVQHRGRLFILDGGTLYFSKNLDECTTSTGDIVGRWEESWPGSYQMNISKDAEIGTAIFSDGIVLYLATSRTVRRLTGSGPENFEEPETIYGEAGVANQDVWQRVFLQGQPVGAAWLTPDCRVIVSDFNTYTDIGTPVQDLLNGINRAAIGTACATFVANGPYDMYVLAIPHGSATTPNVLLVYDLRSRAWAMWSLYDSAISSLLFDIPNASTPVFVFADGTGGIWQFDENLVIDRYGSVNAAISCIAEAAWQSFGDAALRKHLDTFEIEAAIPANVAVTIEGASTVADFDTPHTVVTAQTPVQSPLGPYKVYLAAAPTVDRYYRPTLEWTGAQSINGWAFDVLPLNRF